MKIFITALFLTLSATSFAVELPVNDQIAADVIVRQVVAKKLLKSKHELNLLTAMVNRTIKAPYTSIEVVSIQCDYILGGRDVCDLDVVDATDDGTESMSRLHVTIEKGEVKNASFSLIAG